MNLPNRRLRICAVSIACVLRHGTILIVMSIATGIATGQGGASSQTTISLDKQFADELPRIDPLSSSESLKRFSLKPGYNLELVAHEPNIADPVAIAFDEKARMFVVEMIDYSEQSEEKLGAIKLLEDKDGDGFYETSSRFATGLSWPTAIACFDQGVIVGAAPDILFLKDIDDDGIADINRKVFTGFGRGNVQGLVNSFRWGLDNRLYGQTSVSAGVIKSSVHPDAEPVNLNGRDFSIDPQRWEIRIESGGGQHGMSFDDFGNRFTCHNSDNLQAFLYDHRYELGKQLMQLPPSRRSIATDGAQASVFRTSPVEPWRILRTKLRVSGVVPGLLEGGGRPSGYFTSATGVTIYNGNQMPDLYGQAFIADVGSNLVHRKRLSRDGVGWKGDRIDIESEFIASADTWFRPVQFANAPDGCLYVLDFYREVIEHPLSLPDSIKRHLDLTNGRDKGRIYRLRDARQPVIYRQGLESYSEDQLIEALSHANGWHRETARRLLWAKLSKNLGSSASQGALNKIEFVTTNLAKDASGQGRAGGLDGLGLLVLANRIPSDLRFWLEHQDSNVRMSAIRLLETLAFNHLELRQKLYEMASDADVGVRFQLALSMSLLPNTREELVGRRNAIRILLDQMTLDPAYQAAVGNLIEPHATSLMHEYLSYLISISGAGQGSAAQSEIPVPNIAALEVLGFCFASVASIEELQDFDRQWGRIGDSFGSDSVYRLLKGVLDGLNVKRGFVADSLSGYPALRGSMAKLVERSVSRLNSTELPLEERVDAIHSLRWAGEDVALEIYYSLLSPTHPILMQEKALEGLGAYRDSSVAKGILERYRSLTPTVRGRAIDLLIRRPVWLGELLDQLEQGRVSVDDFSVSQRLALQNHSNQNVRDRVAKYFENNNTDRSKVIAQYQTALSLPGNVENGRGHFVKLCSACHKADGVGYEVGPNLIAFRYRGPEAILQNVLDPNREVNPMYLSYNIMTNDETTISGMIESESTEVVNLTRGGAFRDAIPRQKIAEMKSSRVSIMPEGFENQLDQQAMADLLAYLMQLR